MARRRSGRDVHGVVLLDKPAGMTSNRAVQKVRRLFDARKAGHTGTLDPFATGLLPICLGEATKTAAFLLDAGKSYRAIAILGLATDTGDIEGDVCRTATVPKVSIDDINRTMDAFRGAIRQVPPMYSALKKNGRPLYELARQGLTVERESRPVQVFRLEPIGWESPRLEFEVDCSKGTYIRTLAEDLAEALGSCGHLKSLRRTRVEPFHSEDMVSVETLEGARETESLENYLLPVDSALPGWPIVTLDGPSVDSFVHGNAVAGGLDTGWVRVYGPGNIVLGLGEIDEQAKLQPKRVFVYDRS